MDLTISTLTLESFLLIVVRTGCLLSVSPIFGHKSVNAKLRVLVAVCVSLTIFSAMDFPLPEYDSVFGYSALVIKEAFVGLTLGFVGTIVMNALIMAGEFIDREIGFTMATNFDMNVGGLITITAELYDRMVCLVILITNMHHYILYALIQSYELVPVGDVFLNMPVIYNNIISYIIQCFVIGFRIAMPVFLGAMILNVILGVLAKSAPQMNMFAVGIQMKVFVGMAILTITLMFIPNIAKYLMETMQHMMNDIMGGM